MDPKLAVLLRVHEGAICLMAERHIDERIAVSLSLNAMGEIFSHESLFGFEFDIDDLLEPTKTDGDLAELLRAFMDHRREAGHGIK